MTEARFALVVRFDGSFGIVDWPTEPVVGLNLLAQELNATCIAQLGLWPCVSMWVGADAAPGTAPLNRFAERIHGASGYDVRHYYGTAVLTGGLTGASTHTGLTLDRCHELLKLASITAPAMPMQRTK